MPPDQAQTPGASRIEEMAELVRKLCLALTNAEMFTADHPLGRQNISNAFTWLQGMFQRRSDPVVISVANRRIILDGLPLEDKNPLVNKFASRLEDVHASNLMFQPTVTADEFHSFYRVLGKGARFVNEHGGLASLLAEAKVTGIQLRDISYVMVTDEQKVVSRSAKVEDAQVPGGALSDPELVRYVVSQILSKAEEQRWLIGEIKNNPQRVAGLFTEAINLAVSRAEMGINDEGSAMESLARNIRLVATSLLDEQTGEVKEGQEELEKAIMTLENEMRLRASTLTSSRVATGFVNEILSVITSYSDRIRAKRISGEFLKSERSLKAAEEIIRSMTPREEPLDQFLNRVRDLLVRKGVSGDELSQIEAGIARKAKARAARASRPRKAFNQAVADGITKRLRDLNLEGSQLSAAIESLSAFVEERAREKAGELRETVEKLQDDLDRRNRALNHLPVGLVLWNAEGAADFVNTRAMATLGEEQELHLTPPLRAALEASTFPLVDPQSVADRTAELGEAGVRLLQATAVVLSDEVNGIYGVILRD